MKIRWPLRKREKGSRDECADAGSRKLIEAWIKEEKRELAFGKNSKPATTAGLLRAAEAAARLLDSPAA
jgi:hypothetical protein